jgi:probable HAF family extracellular repeat protein
MKKYHKFSIGVLGAALLSFQSLNAQVYTITTDNNYYYPEAVTNDGVVSLYGAGSLSGDSNAYLWDKNNGLKVIGNLPYPSSPQGYPLVSQDGKKVFWGTLNPASHANEIAIYDVDAGSWTYLGGIGGTIDGWSSSPFGIAPDGNTVVGLGWMPDGTSHGVKWTTADGWTDLGSSFEGRSSRANAVSDNGNIIAGWQDDSNGNRNAVRWVNGIQQPIVNNLGNLAGEPFAISSDGKTMCGYDAVKYAYVWTESTGYTPITDPIADVPFSNYLGAANSISGDGKTVVGAFRYFTDFPEAGVGFIWTAEKGKISLNDYVDALGIDRHGISFNLPLAISKDGTKITGAGLDYSGGGDYGTLVTYMIDLSATMATQNVNVKKLAVYPNPTKDMLTISGVDKPENIEVYNLAGQKVKTFAASDKIDVSGLVKGVYVLQITANGKKQNTKFVKE